MLPPLEPYASSLYAPVTTGTKTYEPALGNSVTPPLQVAPAGQLFTQAEPFQIHTTHENWQLFWVGTGEYSPERAVHGGAEFNEYAEDPP